MDLTYRHFLDVMEELGFLDHIYEELPPHFTAVFDIARILEDDRVQMARELAPVMQLHQRQVFAQVVSPPDERQIILNEPEYYEAAMIRSPNQVPRIYVQQWLWPDEVFYWKLAKKELWYPHEISPTLLSVEPEREEYLPDTRKQKLYILLDTSASMGVHNRIHVAKAIVYQVLRRNLKELGYISFRTFDVAIGELQTAQDSAGYHALMRHLMRRRPLGKGTAMASAIQTAVTDIRSLPHLADTEILIVTDGACVLHEQELRNLLEDDIAIHTVKIGNVQFHPSRKYVEEFVQKEKAPEHHYFLELLERQRQLRHLKDSTASATGRKRYDDALHHVEVEIQKQLQVLAADVIGHELERLSSVYLTIDDIDLSSALHMSEKEVVELVGLFHQILMEMDLGTTASHLRKLALLEDHLDMLLAHMADSHAKERLLELRCDIEKALSEYIGEKVDLSHAEVVERMQEEDRSDIRFLLPSLSKSLWRITFLRLILLVKKIIRKTKRLFSR